MGIGLIWTSLRVNSPWRLFRSHAAIACQRHRDAAPLRMSCEPPAHIEALLHQLTLLLQRCSRWILSKSFQFSAARRPLSLPDKPQVSWDDIRDAIIYGLVVGGNSSPPPEVTGLLSGFLRRLPLPRLVHFLDMIVPQLVPVKSPCRTSVDSAAVMLWKKGVGTVTMLLTLNARSAICIGPELVWLACSSIGTSNQCYC